MPPPDGNQRGPPADTTDFEIDGKYKVTGPVLGRGAWSSVRRCLAIGGYQPPNAAEIQNLVVKMIDKQHLMKLTRGDSSRADGEVDRELNTLAALPPHPSIAVFVEAIKTETHYHLIFEAAPNGDLCEKILNSPAGKLDEATAKRYTFQMVNAVLHCHKNGIAHRDIKPENMLLGERDQLKLTDFGLAKFVPLPAERKLWRSPTNVNPLPAAPSVADIVAMARAFKFHPALEGFPENPSSLCSEVVGTPRYGAPEMFEAKAFNKHYNGYLADCWSLGVVVYIMLTGAFPFSPNGDSDRSTFEHLSKATLHVPAEVSPVASDFLRKLLHKDPTKRMRLWEALDHEWLEECVVGSELAALSGMSTQNGYGGVIDVHHLPAIVHSQLLRLHRRDAMMALRKTSSTEVSGMTAVGPRRMSDAAARQSSPSTSRPKPLAVSSPLPSPTRRAVAGSPSRVAPGDRTPVPASRSPGPGNRAATPVRVLATPVAVERRAGSENQSQQHTPPQAPIAPTSPQHVAPAVKPAPVRNNSPLARSSPTVRRGTPLRTVPGSPMVKVPPTTQATTSASPVPHLAVPTSGAANTASSGGMPTPVRRPVSSVSLRSPAPGMKVSSPPPTLSSNHVQVGEAVTYKGKEAVVRFRGETTFAPGLWLGLEMKEAGGEGLHDGRSFVDKVKYFDCPKGHGVFVRESQVAKV